MSSEAHPGSDFAPGTVITGRGRRCYEIVCVTGKGTFGTVYKARTSFGQIVALKAIRGTSGNSGVREAALLRRVQSSPVFPTLFDAFALPTHFCIVLELLGYNLFEVLKIGGFAGFSHAVLRRISVQVVAGLKYLHDNGIVHCDLKPENILVSDPATVSVKIVDLGNALDTTADCFYVQSRYYRAPEVVVGLPYDSAVDVWSLGCVLYELFCGHPLLPGRDNSEMAARMAALFGEFPRWMVEHGVNAHLLFDRVVYEDSGSEDHAVEENFEHQIEHNRQDSAKKFTYINSQQAYSEFQNPTNDYQYVSDSHCVQNEYCKDRPMNYIHQHELTSRYNHHENLEEPFSTIRSHENCVPECKSQSPATENQELLIFQCQSHRDPSIENQLLNPNNPDRSTFQCQYHQFPNSKNHEDFVSEYCIRSPLNGDRGIDCQPRAYTHCQRKIFIPQKHSKINQTKKKRFHNFVRSRENGIKEISSRNSYINFEIYNHIDRKPSNNFNSDSRDIDSKTYLENDQNSRDNDSDVEYNDISCTSEIAKCQLRTDLKNYLGNIHDDKMRFCNDFRIEYVNPTADTSSNYIQCDQNTLAILNDGQLRKSSVQSTYNSQIIDDCSSSYRQKVPTKGSLIDINTRQNVELLNTNQIRSNQNQIIFSNPCHDFTVNKTSQNIRQNPKDNKQYRFTHYENRDSRFKKYLKSPNPDHSKSKYYDTSRYKTKENLCEINHFQTQNEKNRRNTSCSLDICRYSDTISNIENKDLNISLSSQIETHLEDVSNDDEDSEYSLKHQNHDSADESSLIDSKNSYINSKNHNENRYGGLENHRKLYDTENLKNHKKHQESILSQNLRASIDDSPSNVAKYSQCLFSNFYSSSEFLKQKNSDYIIRTPKENASKAARISSNLSKGSPQINENFHYEDLHYSSKKISNCCIMGLEKSSCIKENQFSKTNNVHGTSTIDDTTFGGQKQNILCNNALFKAIESKKRNNGMKSPIYRDTNQFMKYIKDSSPYYPNKHNLDEVSCQNRNYNALKTRLQDYSSDGHDHLEYCDDMGKSEIVEHSRNITNKSFDTDLTEPKCPNIHHSDTTDNALDVNRAHSKDLAVYNLRKPNSISNDHDKCRGKHDFSVTECFLHHGSVRSKNLDHLGDTDSRSSSMSLNGHINSMCLKSKDSKIDRSKISDVLFGSFCRTNNHPHHCKCMPSEDLSPHEISNRSDDNAVKFFNNESDGANSDNVAQNLMNSGRFNSQRSKMALSNHTDIYSPIHTNFREATTRRIYKNVNSENTARYQTPYQKNTISYRNSKYEDTAHSQRSTHDFNDFTNIQEMNIEENSHEIDEPYNRASSSKLVQRKPFSNIKCLDAQNMINMNNIDPSYDISLQHHSSCSYESGCCPNQNDIQAALILSQIDKNIIPSFNPPHERSNKLDKILPTRNRQNIEIKETYSGDQTIEKHDTHMRDKFTNIKQDSPRKLEISINNQLKDTPSQSQFYELMKSQRNFKTKNNDQQKRTSIITQPINSDLSKNELNNNDSLFSPKDIVNVSAKHDLFSQTEINRVNPKLNPDINVFSIQKSGNSQSPIEQEQTSCRYSSSFHTGKPNGIFYSSENDSKNKTYKVEKKQKPFLNFTYVLKNHETVQHYPDSHDMRERILRDSEDRQENILFYDFLMMMLNINHLERPTINHLKSHSYLHYSAQMRPFETYPPINSRIEQRNINNPQPADRVDRRYSMHFDIYDKITTNQNRKKSAYNFSFKNRK